MKFFIASDIHGSLYYAELMMSRFNEENCDRMLILGDILYHGPRNDLPKGYNPKGVIELLNKIGGKILSVRGNCDTEVDQMVLSFPVLAEYGLVSVGEKAIYMSHGHNIPDSIKCLGNIILSGHTHIPVCVEETDYIQLNPGSVSIPKENSPHSYMTFDGKVFLWKNLETGEIYKEFSL